MTVIVLEVVALIFQRIECLIFDFHRARPPPHRTADGVLVTLPSR